MDEEQLYENSTKIEPMKDKKTEKKNPLYGQLSPRLQKRSSNMLEVTPHHLINGDGKQETRVTNPIYNHPKLMKSNSVLNTSNSSSAYRLKSAPPIFSDEIKREPSKPKRTLSRLKFRKRSKTSSFRQNENVKGE